MYFALPNVCFCISNHALANIFIRKEHFFTVIGCKVTNFFLILHKKSVLILTTTEKYG